MIVVEAHLRAVKAVADVAELVLQVFVAVGQAMAAVGRTPRVAMVG